MGTIADKLTKLQETKSALKTAINGSGSTVGDVFSDYPTAVTNGKAGIAAEITNLGIETAADATFSQMAENLNGIKRQEAITITPGIVEKTAIPAGTYAAGAATVAGDANLVPENIKEGVSIFGVAGSFAGGGLQEVGRIDWWNNASVDNAFILLEYDGSGASLGSTKYSFIFGAFNGPYYAYTDYCEVISAFRYVYRWLNYGSLDVTINDYDSDVANLFTSADRENISNGFSFRYFLIS